VVGTLPLGNGLAVLLVVDFPQNLQLELFH
jgi:hypothetical protein